MISFRRREDIAPSILILLSIAILTGTLAYMLFVPPPSVAGVVTSHEQGRRQMLSEIADARQRQRQARATIGHHLWRGGSGAVSAATLALLTQQAKQNALQLGAFRPQRTQALAGMTELPFSVRLTGSYPKIQAVTAALDSAASNVVLRSVEIASSNAKSDTVEATLGVSAYVASDPASLQEPVPSRAARKPAAKGRHV